MVECGPQRAPGGFDDPAAWVILAAFANSAALRLPALGVLALGAALADVDQLVKPFLSLPHRELFYPFRADVRDDV